MVEALGHGGRTRRVTRQAQKQKMAARMVTTRKKGSRMISGSSTMRQTWTSVRSPNTTPVTMTYVLMKTPLARASARDSPWGPFASMQFGRQLARVLRIDVAPVVHFLVPRGTHDQPQYLVCRVVEYLPEAGRSDQHGSMLGNRES